MIKRVNFMTTCMFLCPAVHVRGWGVEKRESIANIAAKIEKKIN
jgi:hypothetical protein